VQHGGGYGTYEIDSLLENELKGSDHFISWGWDFREKVIPAPSCELSMLRERYQRRMNDKKEGVLFCGGGRPRYVITIQSCTEGATFKEYIEDQIRFFQVLSAGVKKELLVRLYLRDWEWDSQQRIKDKVEGLKFDDFKESFNARLMDCRVAIFDNNQTTYLKSIALNIPTLLFWDDQIWPLNEPAKPYFEALKDAKVFHTTPESAGRFLNENFDRIDTWWGSDEVQTAVSRFRDKFARVSEDYQEEWQDLIGQICGNDKGTNKMEKK